VVVGNPPNRIFINLPPSIGGFARVTRLEDPAEAFNRFLFAFFFHAFFSFVILFPWSEADT
jgi:hypothetical protein